ncbi:hypothetical protein R3P38DRAFT_2801316 [Favolaschia claudopus]|uniref:Uncharacterized protein n=1 Tax=Favolaschia claudopus TaxID=2862362 RepID=A0AAV9ZVJ0_9AGAR
MRSSYTLSTVVLSLLLAVSAAPAKRAEIQCPPQDKNGVAFTSSSPAAHDPQFITCVYQGGAGFCTYFPADGSFSSGSSQCPKGIAQDPSVTTDAPSTAGGDATPTSAAPPSSSSASDAAPPPPPPVSSDSAPVPPTSASGSGAGSAPSPPPISPPSQSQSQSQSGSAPAPSQSQTGGAVASIRGVGVSVVLGVAAAGMMLL